VKKLEQTISNVKNCINTKYTQVTDSLIQQNENASFGLKTNVLKTALADLRASLLESCSCK